MKQKRSNISKMRGRGTSTFVQLPDDVCLRVRKAGRCTLPPSLIAAQFNFHLQLYVLAHFIIACQRIEYTYDNANRMTQIVEYNAAGSNVKNIGFTYDTAGNLKTYSDGTTSASYTYDELYRKTQETVTYGAFSLTTGYAYNKNGTKKSFTYPNGSTVTYTYDANNQITGVNVPYAGNISYDAYQWTRPTGVTLPSGSGAKQFAYDELMRTKTMTSSDPSQNALMNYQYTYDKMDNIKTRNTQSGNYAYNYDNLYRLNEVKKDENQTEGFTYDQVGNRLTSSATTGGWTYNTNNELLSYNGTTNQYDANGNTIQRSINGQVQNFVYDVDNRLIEVRDEANNLIATYTYDPFGRRIRKIVSPSGGGSGEEVYYLYSDEGLIGEYGNTGSQIRIYGYKPNSTWSTDPLFMREGGNIYFYHNDHLGTPQKMTNISGQTVWSATYDAFGKATIDAASTITSNLRFPGQYYDAETGWYYNWNRFFDPNTGRYVTEDPIGLDGGDINLYRYVVNNPMSWHDPWGLQNNAEALRIPQYIPPEVWPYIVLTGRAIVGAVTSIAISPEAVAVVVVGGVIAATATNAGEGSDVLPPPAIPKPKKEDCKRGQRRCRGSIRYAPPHIMAQCPHRVYGIGDNMHDCQNDAKFRAPQQCRQYYGHFKWIP